jgi:hypothetical protein
MAPLVLICTPIMLPFVTSLGASVASPRRSAPRANLLPLRRFQWLGIRSGRPHNAFRHSVICSTKHAHDSHFE